MDFLATDGHSAYTNRRSAGPMAKGRHYIRPALRRQSKGAGVPFDLGVLGRYKLRDLRGVERRALAQVVAADEELDAERVIERLADPAHPGGVGTHHVGRRRVLATLRVVVQYHASRGAQRLPGTLPAHRLGEPRVHGDRVRGDHGDADPGGGDPERRQAEDLPRFVANLKFL